jgi:hypothetical protein
VTVICARLLAAAAYTTVDGTQVVVAFRGTTFQATKVGLNNIMADYGLFNRAPTATLQRYARAAAYFVAEVQAQSLLPSPNITITGHSLGGALAQLVGNASKLTAVAFDAPGSAELYKALQNLLTPVVWPSVATQNPNVNYRMYGDVVSEVPKAFFAVMTVFTPYPYPIISPVEDPLKVYAEYLTYALNNHSIQLMVEQLAQGPPPIAGFLGPNLLSVILSGPKAPWPTASAPVRGSVPKF